MGIVSASATAWIVGEGDPKPLSRLTLSNPALVPKKAVALIVVTDEIARDTSAAGQSLISQELRAAVADTVDEAFFDTIMPGASSNPSSGSDQLSMVADLRGLLGSVNTTGVGGSLFWTMSVDVGNRVALINDGKGAMSPTGGEFLNLPALVSGAIPAGTLRLVNASAIAANADSISLDASGQVSIHMRDDPDAEAALVSMFQSNGVALKAEVSFGVEKTRADAVAEITGIEW
ncbi:phage major capsid protein [Rhizobium leguminosarum]|nr:phage major capsid protein [Rhizobium leguminosarum]